MLKKKNVIEEKYKRIIYKVANETKKNCYSAIQFCYYLYELFMTKKRVEEESKENR